ncbi:hypothetical protein QBC39DRAFT_107739 [Podospora conica]|nr:hypothetical protein QBC39DRAFT_107739 [Schizothecium conicum]
MPSPPRLCAWTLFFFFFLVCPFSDRDIGVGGADGGGERRRHTRNRRAWTRGRDGIRTSKYTRCSPSLSFVAIDEESAVLGAAAMPTPMPAIIHANAVLCCDMMAAMFPVVVVVVASRAPFRCCSCVSFSLFFLPASLTDQQQRQSLHKGAMGCAVLWCCCCCGASSVRSSVTAWKKAGRRCGTAMQTADSAPRRVCIGDV